MQQISIHSLKVAPFPPQNFGESLKFYHTFLSRWKIAKSKYFSDA